MTFAEVNRFILAFNENKRNSMKETAAFAHALAMMVGAAFGGKLPKLEEIFPTLFTDSIDAPPATRDEMDMARVREFVTAWNNRPKEVSTDG